MSDLIFKTGGTEIEKTKQEIEVLTAKLALLEEMEKHKTPAEEAFKRVYGYYPVTNHSHSEDDKWNAFQDGYDAAFFEGCKVEEEPEELKTLYQMWNDGECRDDICYLVKSWLSQYEIDGWEDDWEGGFSDCLDKLNKGLK